MTITQFLFGAALKGSLLLGCALLGALCLRRAAGRHQVLSLAMGGLLLLPLLPLLLPRWELPRLPAGAQEVPPGLAAAVAPAASAKAVARVSAPVAAAAVPQLAAPRPLRWQAWLGGVFLIGLLAALGRLGAGFLAARLLRRGAVPLDDAEWAAQLAAAREQLGVVAPVRLYVTERPLMPLTFGTLRPAVLLPAEARAWPADRRRLVLLHELSHIKRRDCLLQAVAQLACALHWYNPLAWLAQRLMRRERELAADALVLAAGVRPSTYAGELLALARGLAAAPVPAVAMAGRSRLGGRVLRILDPRADHRPLGWRFHLLSCALLLGLLLPLGTLTGWAAGPAAPRGLAVAGLGSLLPAAAVTPAQQRLRDQATAHLESVLGQRPAEVELTIDPLAQSLIEQELDALTQRLRPAGASIVALDPQSGAILGLGSRGGGGRNLAVEQAYEPASTLKVFTVAAALDAGAVAKEQRFQCDGTTRAHGGGVIRDVAPAGQLSVTDILVKSSNIGAVKIYRALGKERLLRALSGLRFGERPEVQLPAAAAGSDLRADWPEAQAETLALGHGLTASPLQVAAAFAAVANQGAYHAPTLVRKAVGPGGAVLWQPASRPQQVLKPETAQAVLAMLEGVVHRDDGTGPAARVAGYRVAGKTGTGDRTGLFVGAVPAERPRLVLLVTVDGAQGMSQVTGNTVAAPSFRRIAEQLLPHLGAQPARL